MHRINKSKTETKTTNNISKKICCKSFALKNQILESLLEMILYTHAHVIIKTTKNYVHRGIIIVIIICNKSKTETKTTTNISKKICCKSFALKNQILESLLEMILYTHAHVIIKTTKNYVHRGIIIVIIICNKSKTETKTTRRFATRALL